MATETVRGGALPRKNNLIGTGAGGVLKSVCLKLANSARSLSLPSL